MLDIKYIKENPDEVIERLAKKGKDAKDEIEAILALDAERRALISSTEAIKAEQNKTNKLIPQYKKEGRDVSEIFAKMKEMGAPLKENRLVEEDIVDKFVTSALVEKEFAKIVNETGGWSSKMIPRLLSSVYHELVCEEMWNILKKFKNPAINFRVLNNFTIAKIKKVKPEIFG